MESQIFGLFERLQFVDDPHQYEPELHLPKTHLLTNFLLYH